MKKQDKKTEVSFGDLLKSFLSLLKGKSAWIVVIFLLTIFSSFFAVIIPIYVREIIDSIGSNDKTLIGHVFNLIYIIIALRLCAWLIFRSKEYITSWFMILANARLRNGVFAYLINHSQNFFANHFVGSLTKKVNDYANSFQTILFQIESTVIPLLVQLVGASIVIFREDQKVGLVFSIGFFFIILLNIILAMIKRKFDRKSSSAMSHTTGFTADSLTNNTASTLFSARAYEVSLRAEKESIWKYHKKRQWFFGDTIYTVQGLIFIVIEYFILKYSVSGWFIGSISSGEFAMFQFYVIGSFVQITALSFSIRMIYEGYAEGAEVVDLLKIPHEIIDTPQAGELKVSSGKILFDTVSFAYSNENEVLSNIELAIEPKTKLGLVGPSGAGKSTFVKLLLRFFDVTAGHIFIDGVDIKTVTQDSLHKNIAFVPQDPVLFHRTLIDNIRYGKFDATDEEVVEAARKAHAHEFISKLKDGYMTLVGERGIKLSGGERQRVAIARAILKDAPILVLDEATSALDSESERLIQDALRRLMENKTVIVIAHRLSTIQKMDRIIVFDNGKIIEDGTHDALVSKSDSLYKKLWELQAGGFIQDEK